MKNIIVKTIFISGLCLSIHAQKTFQCINTENKVLFSLEAEFVHPFSYGLAAFQRANNNQYLWGFVNEKGETQIVPAYEKVSRFYKGVCWVKLPKGNYILIDKAGNQISKKEYKKVGVFMEDLCAVYEDLNMGFVNLKGEEVIPCKYTGSPAFSDGLVCLCLADEATEVYGFLDKNGQVAIPFKYKMGGFANFVNGECRVKLNGKTCLINKKGELVFAPSLANNMEHFCNGLAMAYTKPDRTGVGYFNRKQQWIIKPVYESGKNFSNGYTIVQQFKRYGVIDTSGKIIIPIEYDNLYGKPEEDGFYIAEKGGSKYYLKSNGKAFTDLNVSYILSGNKHDLFPFKSSQGKMGYLNKDGIIAIEAAYDKAESFSENKAWIR